ncbi:MAG: peptide ABC transporter substrate-binding protein [Candidatus Krumholzibacteriota bacterium]|nr:peptide ABC transporter substrate-binding protein [Candidatus Krumholzibacteriota bacterium]
MNEAVNSMVSVVYVCNLIFSKFVKHNQKMELIPDLITEIPTLQNGGISENFLVYTYHLRKDARWHDGVPVTSADVKFTWEVMMHPAINVETRQGWDIVDRVDTPDSFTVVFNLSKVYANFAGDCFYDESVLPRHLLEDKLGPDFQSDPFHRSPVGSGPFIFQEWVPGSHIVVKANPAYYGTGPYLDEIVVQFVPSGNALLMQLEAGSVMGIDNAPQELLSLARRLKGVKIYRNPALFNEHIDLNCENPILQDGRVRRALAMAVDRDELSRKIYDGVWVPAWGDEHPDSPYYSPVGREKYAFDPQKAAKLLSESGWIDRDGDGIREKDGKNLTLRISSTAGRLNRERTEVVLKEQFRRLGVELVIKNYHPSVLYASYDEGGILKNGKFDLALYAFLTPPDPSTKEGSYSIDFIPPTGQNNSRLRNRKLTELLAQGSRTVEFSRRKEIYDQVQAILAEEVPIIPLLWVTQLDVMPEKLRGYAPNPTQSGDTWNAAQWWMDR